MKSRSNRVATSDPPDDWVDGSWTVDCICGVNYDDGEEMVNCDECSVWVHTRCFRFPKGEKSFACDKCKNKSLIRNNDSEETEVAQLLVELPTKTIKMSSNSNNNNSHSNSINHRGNHSNSYGGYGNQPSRRPPYRLWVNKPMEERVHVQGVPGGEDDPSLFQGFPILFASELWKCTGYVPKKLNFKYKEFPCWDREEEEVEEKEKEKEVEVNATAKVEGGTESVADRGAGVLYSLSKENVVLNMKRGQSKSGGGLDKKGSKDKKLENGDLKKSGLSKKEKGSILIQCSSKRSRDEVGSLKDRSGKKKIKTIRREQDSQKDNLKAVVVHSSSARQVEVSENKANKVASNAQLADGSHIEKPKRNAANDEGNAVRRSPEVSALGCSSEKKVKAEKPVHDVTATVQKSVKTEIAPLPVADKEGAARNSSKKEGVVLDVIDNNEGALPECQNSDSLKSKPHAEDMDSAIPEHNDSEAAKDLETTVPLISENFGSKTKLDVDVDNPKEVMRSHPSDIDMDLKIDGIKHSSEQAPSPNRECKDSKPNEAVTISSQSHEHECEGQHNDKSLEAVSCIQLVKDEVTNENQCINKVKSDCSENPITVQKSFSDFKEVKVAGDTSKPSVEILPPPSSHHKPVSVGKSSPSSSTVVAPRPVLSSKNRAGSSLYPNSIGKRVTSNSSMATKKENASLDQAKDEIKYEKAKSSTIPISKATQPNKSVTSPVLKHHGKDSLRHPFSKKSSVESSLLPSGVDEPAGLQTQHTSSGQNKNSASDGQNRNEKTLQPNLQSSSKSNQTSSVHPPPSSSAPAGLSDEELALLLHQELNSSPRVPRVPRVRHAGSLPQTSSASATSILIKRGTSSGGKEQYTFSRRKNKDGSRSSRDQDSEARKADRVPSSPDSAKTSDTLTQAEGQNESTQSGRKNADDNSTSAANSRPCSTDAKKLKSSSNRDSSVNNHEDDTGNNKRLPPVHRTLPGLIAEIMGAGRRMTYEELCNAVLPHWQNLRKHNGERYAYSSHSQAVLDCLRNRSEWSRLVDRGPKTNASRKKRKTDVEPSNTESEDGEDRNQRVGKSKSFESNKEDYPKGRRKARKRRRLALRGRGVRDDRKRTKVQPGSDDTGSSSNSSEDTNSSEDDSHGSGMCAAKSEVSASSADMVAAQ